MQKVKFIRDTLPHEWPEPIQEGEVRELPADQVVRWQKRNAIQLVSEEEATEVEQAAEEATEEETQQDPKPAAKRSRKKDS